jgi:hypothetical protein
MRAWWIFMVVFGVMPLSTVAVARSLEQPTSNEAEAEVDQEADTADEVRESEKTSAFLEEVSFGITLNGWSSSGGFGYRADHWRVGTLAQIASAGDVFVGVDGGWIGEGDDIAPYAGLGLGYAWSHADEENETTGMAVRVELGVEVLGSLFKPGLALITVSGVVPLGSGGDTAVGVFLMLGCPPAQETPQSRSSAAAHHKTGAWPCRSPVVRGRSR